MMTNPVIDFFVEGIPAPAIRKVKSDRWAGRPMVEREYAWRERVALKALQFKDRFKRLKYPVYVQVLVCTPERPRGDSDNYYKAAVDALVYKIKLLKGDSFKYIEGHSCQWIKLDKSGMKIMIFNALNKEVPF